MKVHIDLLDLFMSIENLVDSLKEDIVRNSKVLENYHSRLETEGKVVGDWIPGEIEVIQESNAEAALTIMYANSLVEELSPHVDYIRLLCELQSGDIRPNTFNIRYETLTFGDEE